jgi:hypothetical protein
MRQPQVSNPSSGLAPVESDKSKDTLAVVSDFNKLVALNPDWDDFVDSYALSPYYLMGYLGSRFLEHAAEAKRRQQFAVVMNEGDKPLGLGAFRLSDSYILWKPKLFKFRAAKFLLDDSWSPDFVARPDRRKEFVEGTLSLLFGRLGCRSASLTLNSDSPTVPIMIEWCKERRMTVKRRPHARHPLHAVVRVQGTWDDYFKTLGKESIRKYRKSKRRLDGAGSWRVTYERVDNKSVVDKILEVDRSSWKQKMRNERGEGDDLEMARILNFHLRNPESKFCPLVWFLELNGKPIAFELVMILGGTAYHPNGSYDAHYKEFAPGKVLAMIMFQDLFEKENVTRMEFFTFHDNMKAWDPEVKRRDTFLIEDHRGPFKIFLKLRENRYVVRVARAVLRH